MKNCPFYGYSMYLYAGGDKANPPFVLFPTGGNQCALITTATAPCWMEQNQQEPDWKECPYITRNMRIAPPGTAGIDY